jgi:hypothetical protein
MIVEIPTRQEHEGYPGYLGLYEIPDKCDCGGDRGVKRYKGLSYDGSRRLEVDCWENSCGHIDKYEYVRKIGVRVPYPVKENGE